MSAPSEPVVRLPHAEPTRIPLLERGKRAREQQARDLAEEAARKARQMWETARRVLEARMKQVFGEEVAVEGGVTIEVQGEDTYLEQVPAVEVDGLTFVIEPWGGGLTLVRLCPKCGRFVTEAVHGVVDLLNTVESPLSHYRCPAHEGKVAAPPLPIVPTVEQRYLDAVKDLIRQEAST